eukprot:TRINITY_DN12893_c0_g1_i15.p1 TRINITY_DN12893_c0_g1~~TRINITY_DN12893_c0_g1_i15.p1  ORF type:complete len:427 (+),score=49.80 TRINITY_DN12893_c0_g1_i15:26-1306(+)
MNFAKTNLLLLFFVFAFPHAGESVDQEVVEVTSLDDNGDASKTISEYVEGNGFKFEEHKVVTEDGYILTLWRIHRNKTSNGPPVILQHGVIDAGFTFLLSGANRCLALYLGRKGFDVWIANNRGQSYSLGHTGGYRWFIPFSKYWDFSFHEMALYDFPAAVHYVKQVTGYSKVNFIGHSQGATQYFIKASVDPEFVNANIESFVALGPAIFLSSCKSALVRILSGSFRLFDWMHAIGFKYFYVLPPNMLGLTESICRKFPRMYYGLIPTIGGYSEGKNFDLRRWPALCTKSPGGTSTQNLVHWMQMLRSGGKFQMFDYGKRKNLLIYNQETPKEYDLGQLKKVTVPTLIVSGTKDALISEDAIRKVMGVLKNDRSDQVLESIRLEDYAHLDFLWGRNAIKDLYMNLSLIHICRCRRSTLCRSRWSP